MNRSMLAASVAVPILSLSGALSQQASTGHFETFKELLRKRNIELSEPALVAALQNPDSHVRYLAALVLAEDKANDSLPAIETTLAVEKDPETRINIALADSELGGQKGAVALKESCDSPETEPRLRIYAAKYLLDLRKEDCLNTVIEVVQSKSDPATRVLALSLLPRFRSVSSGEHKRIVEACMKVLTDPLGEIRISSGSALAQLADPSAVPALERRLSTEADEAVRSRLQADLSRDCPELR